MQTVELNLILIPEVANCQVTLRRREVIMDCAILLTTARLIVATAILLHIIATDKYLEHHLEKQKSENRHSGDVLSMGSKKIVRTYPKPILRTFPNYT